MIVEQFYTNCLAEAAYYIESNGEAAIIDPMRETAPYIERASRSGAKIKYIFETHFHADFVSGHLDLEKKTGASIVFGPNANPSYNAHIATDGEELKIGNLTIKVLHTPGHTMESTTYLLLNEEGKEHCIFSGDTLFIGDVGRPDLAIKTDLTVQDLAGHLFDSLRNKIMKLPKDVIVYPAHGAGSACGKNLSTDTFDTLENQLNFNYALRSSMTKEEFILEVTDGLVDPPQYFPKNAQLNQKGYDSFENVLERGTKPMSLDEFEHSASFGTLVIDTRSESEFAKGFIPGSVFIGIDGSFATWVGTLIEDLDRPIIFLSDEGKEEEVVTRFSRVGYSNILGYLNGGFQTWLDAGKKTDYLDELTPVEFKSKHEQGVESTVLDVRKESEYNTQHVQSVENFPLDFLGNTIGELDKNKSYMIHCLGGYRSVIASSIFKKFGIRNVINIQGGFKAIEETGIPLTELTEQNTTL